MARTSKPGRPRALHPSGYCLDVLNLLESHANRWKEFDVSRCRHSVDEMRHQVNVATCSESDMLIKRPDSAREITQALLEFGYKRLMKPVKAVGVVGR